MKYAKRIFASGLCAAFVCGFTVNAADRTWTNPSGGDWNTASNWSDALVPTASDRAVFNLNNAYPVTLGGDFAVNALNVDGGAVSLSSATATARRLTTGSLSVGASGVGHLVIRGGGQVAPGTYLVNSANGSSIDMGLGGLLKFEDSSGAPPPVRVQLRTDIAIGYNGYDRQGAGITSTLARTDPRLRVGYQTVTSVGPQRIEVKLTLGGDTNLDGTTNFDDLLKFAHSYNSPFGKFWDEGDFDYDGDIDFQDLIWIAQQYGRTLLSSGEISVYTDLASSFEVDWALAQSMLPEPVSIAVVLGTVPLAARRRLL